MFRRKTTPPHFRCTNDDGTDARRHRTFKDPFFNLVVSERQRRKRRRRRGLDSRIERIITNPAEREKLLSTGTSRIGTTEQSQLINPSIASLVSVLRYVPWWKREHFINLFRRNPILIPPARQVHGQLVGFGIGCPTGDILRGSLVSGEESRIFASEVCLWNYSL